MWSKRLTGRKTSTQLDSRDPLRIPEMLENILGFLPVEDLKTCRLVNKFWKQSALKPMRKKCVNIKFGRSSSFDLYKYGLEDMERFAKCFGGDGVPCSKIEIFTSIIDERISDREKSIVANFFQGISPWVTEITLEEGKDIDHLLKLWTLELVFPSLRQVMFADTQIMHRTHSRAFSPWMSVFIQNSPQLEKISFWSFSGIQGWDFQDTSFNQFLQVLEQNRGLKIKSLNISAQFENDDLIRLSESGFKLRHLNLWIRKLPKQRIAFPHLETLEIWDCDVPANTKKNVRFPIMNKLKSLTLHKSCPRLINYAAQTSSLEKVAFEMWSGFQWTTCLSEEMEPAPGVKELCFRWIGPGIEANSMFEAVRIFPNISKLQLVVHQVPIQIVYNYLPNLKELSLDIPGLWGIDGLLTGLSEEGCRNALRRLRQWTPNFDDSDIPIGINHSPISVLTNLRLLRLRYLWPLWRRQWELQVSEVSLCLALMKMPSLKILDLCEGSQAPDELIQKSVLKEFQKNRVILWKLKDTSNLLSMS